MVDNTYVAEDYFASGTQTVYDDGIGTDWVIISGTYTTTGIGIGYYGCRVHLDWVTYYEPPAADQRVFIEAITYPLLYQTLRIYGTIENVMGGGGVEELVGDGYANILQGDPTDVAGMRDYIWGGGGNDTILGVGGDDYLVGDAGNDLIFGDLDPEAQDQGNIAAGSDSLYGGAGDDTLVGGAGNNEISGGDGFDLVNYAVYHDGLDWGYRVDVNLQTGVATVYGIDFYTGTESIFAVDSISTVEHVRGSDGSDYLRGANAYVLGSPTRNIFDGGLGNDTVVGSWGADDLIGGAGNDMLHDNGNADYTNLADRMTGGTGNDIYIITNSTTIVVEAANEGFDRVVTRVSYQMADNLENAALLNSSDGTYLIGNALANLLVGDGFANSFYSGGGADTMNGGGGNDTYFRHGGEVIVELAGGGVDTVVADISTTLAAQVENLILSDYYAGAIYGGGNALANQLTGNSRANWLNGGAGADTLSGGEGNDTYVTDGLDTIIEQNLRGGLGGTDTVRSTASYTLGLALENLVLLGTGNLSGTGNSGANRLTGNDGANRLYGGAGNDTLAGGLGADRLGGGLGNDRLTGGAGADRFLFASTSGADTVVDFQDGIDRLVFFTGGAPVLPVSVTDSGLNVLVQYGAATITLLNVDSTLIGAADFIFA